MMRLFRFVFSSYGEVRKYPKFTNVSGFHWCVYCDLDSTFEFLLVKPRDIPKWATKDSSLFLSFLAGYFDAEGCIGFDTRTANHSVAWIVRSCDLHILRSARRNLQNLGYHSSLRLARRAGELNLKRDFWSLSISDRGVVSGLLAILPLLHPEKVAKARLVATMKGSHWNTGWVDVGKLRAAIKAEVTCFRREAESALAAR